MRLRPRDVSHSATVGPSQAADVGGHEGQPGKQRDLLDVEPALVIRYSGIQAVNVTQVGSARKRGIAMPQVLRCLSRFHIEGLVPLAARCAS